MNVKVLIGDFGELDSLVNCGSTRHRSQLQISFFFSYTGGPFSKPQSDISDSLLQAAYGAG